MRVKTSKGDLPVHFGMNTLAEFGDQVNKSMNDVMKSLSNMGSLKLSDLMAFFYAAFKEGAIEAGEECLVLDRREVGKMIDNDPEMVTKMLSAFSEQSSPEEGLAEEGDGKKK
jgi:hypothetical protein